MKWLFLLLLIINVGIFAWGYQHEQIVKQPAVEAGADVGSMRLISELTDSDKQENVETADEAEVVIAKAEQPEIEHTSATETKQDQGEKGATETDAKKEAVPEPKIATKAETKVKPTTEIKQKVETKQEKESEQQVASVDTQSKQSASVEQPNERKKAKKKPGTVSRCGVIGPLKDRQVAKDVMDDLIKSDLEAKLERKIEKEQIGYWVVIPPLPDGSQAQAKIDELAQVGLKDIWHFRGGGMKNAISLGMFAQKENAEKLSEEVLKKGFKTEMRPRYLNKTKYLVKFSIAKTKTVTDNMWQDVEQKYSKMPFSEQPCESIASK